MLNILVDTCVWLDSAKHPDQRSSLSVLQELIDRNEVRLIVPQIVLKEFERNKKRIIQESGRSLADTFKRVKEAVERFGDPKVAPVVMRQLNDVDHRIPLLGEAANGSILFVERLLKSVTPIEISDGVKARAAQRGIDKIAPFRGSKNGTADAILIEVYADQLATKGERFAFVTHNCNDFSDPNGDTRKPHPDLATLFTRFKSRYFIRLGDALNSVHRDLVSEIMLEHDGWIEAPRKLSEILDALSEMVDKMWYDRHCFMAQKIEAGKHRIVTREDWDAHPDPQGTTIDSVWAGAERSARTMERKYGKENLGPWTKFEWGMLNGKISALRWVLGEDWDELYT